MIDTMFYALLGMAILFLLLTVKWKSLSLGLLDIILWFILSAAVHSFEIPYTAITSTDTIVQGVHEIQSLYSVSLIFTGIGFIVLIYWLIDIVFPLIHQKYSRMM